MSFFEELKRRNVFRVGIAYAVASWVLLQVADLVLEAIKAPDWVLLALMLVTGLGFIVALIIAWAYEMTPEGIKREADVNREASVTHHTAAKLDRITIGLLIAAVAIVAFDRFVPKTEGLESVQQTEQIDQQVDVADAPEADTKSIAVLPFVNMSSDPEQEFFSDGISEEILNALAKVKDLKVAGRTSSFAFKGENQDLRQIGEALSVNHILEGSVRKAGNQVRITAQLIQVSDGYHLWSETYDRELTNIFAIQDEIATAILNELKAELLSGESEAMVSTETDPRAYELYLLAKQRLYERQREPIEAAVKMLDSALEIAPDYAPALAQRGIATLLLTRRNYGTLSREEAEPIALNFLERAVAIDPGLGEAWAGLGLYYREQPAEDLKAIELLEKALELNPNLINASNWLQSVYSSTRQAAKAYAILKDMIARDPLYKPGMGNMILYYNARGMTEQALALIERNEPFMPGDPSLTADRGLVALTEGKVAQAIKLYEQSFEQAPEDGSSRVGWGIGLLATHQYEKLLGAYMPPWQRIFAMQALGRQEEARISAHERAAIGDIGSLLALMNREGRPQDVVQFFDDRWPDLDAFQVSYPGGSINYEVMLSLAYAFMKTGDESRFEDAMQRLDAHLSYLETEGIYFARLNFERASWHLMRGDEAEALAQIETAIGKGEITSRRIAWRYPALAPLEGNPAFEALQQKMIEHLNAERAELGLEPIET